MGSIAIPSSRIDSVYVGNTNVSNPLLMLSIAGAVYPNGYRIEYSGGYRNFFASVTDAGNVYIECQSIAYQADLPEFTLSSVEVLVIG